ncbi:serine hydrolase domain-containing protein [Deinococcus wulumuqiensis]|uniref:serine hydrolase domain-containing protein n=1 Tax=Deinococcus wulumuqiensis TaxID=980427 RepID=UPI00242C1091|nr:serine hydrolase [Deinococcus wulumuqiensis]
MTEPLPWPSLAAAGVDPQAVLNFLTRLERDGLEVHALELWRRGRPALQGSWSPYRTDTLHQLHSVSKSFLSAAVGLCVSEGRFGLDDRVLDFFPADREQAARGVSDLTVRHLLTMSSGHAEAVRPRLNFTDPRPWVPTYLHAPLAHSPGTHFLYDSADSFMLSATVQQVTGQRVLDFLRPRLLEPLGIGTARWLSSPEGVNTGGWGLRLTTSDLARFGELLRCGGVWQGRPLLPAAWLEQAIHPQIPTTHADPDWACGYGFQFWPSRHGAYRADGMLGQFVLVLPAQEAVLAVTAGTPRMQALLDAVWDELLPSFHAEALPEGLDVAERLRRALADLHLPLPFVPQPPAAHGAQTSALPAPTSFLADDQLWTACWPGWTHLTLRWGEESTLTLTCPQGSATLGARWDRWTVQLTDLFEDEQAVQVATHAARAPDGALHFTVRLVTQLRECRLVQRPGEALEVYLPHQLGQPGVPLTAPASYPQGVS